MRIGHHVFFLERIISAELNKPSALLVMSLSTNALRFN
jgi:hypothetical protein